MEKIILLTDYKGYFSSKWSAIPYRSGMDKELITKYFAENNFVSEFKSFVDIDFNNEYYKGKYILYSSSEDNELYYKSYIEDVCYGLELAGARLIPPFKFLKAHHNKVFMEILRSTMGDSTFNNIKASFYGTIEELKKKIDSLNYPVVFKGASGATSTTVYLAKNKKELLRIARNYSRTINVGYDVHDIIRWIRRRGYIRESFHRRKFVVQEFIPNLDRDWKILIFGEKYYVLERRVRKNDFRASGSGILNYTECLPDGLLDYASDFYKVCKLPFLAIDLAYNGSEFFLIEFQALHFGTHTLDTSPFYFVHSESKWKKIKGNSILEEEYVNSIVKFVQKNFY
ncbi:MAG: hypothetical protein JXA68_05090 [Ignavibacteriales bacterium]|nr:hypothetical protein [Ignavibacteriales bacterium]